MKIDRVANEWSDHRENVWMRYAIVREVDLEALEAELKTEQLRTKEQIRDKYCILNEYKGEVARLKAKLTIERSKIWIVEWDFYQESGIEGVYSSEKKAEEAAEQFRKAEKIKTDFRVEEYEVQ